MARTPLRPEAVREFADMSDGDLTEVYFFGNLAAGPHTVVFKATTAQKFEAGRLLRERGVILPRRPDPRPVLDGPAGREAVALATEQWRTERDALLGDRKREGR